MICYIASCVDKYCGGAGEGAFSNKRSSLKPLPHFLRVRWIYIDWKLYERLEILRISGIYMTVELIFTKRAYTLFSSCVIDLIRLSVAFSIKWSAKIKLKKTEKRNLKLYKLTEIFLNLENIQFISSLIQNFHFCVVYSI